MLKEGTRSRYEEAMVPSGVPVGGIAMSVSSILFRGQEEPFDTETDQPERPTRSLRRMLKPWPFSSAPLPVSAADYDDDDDEEFMEPTPAVVLDRLAQFAARR
jgi:hypothetical protein